MSTALTTLFYSCIAGVATIIGIHLIIVHEQFAKKYSHHLMSFAAGIILATAFFHLIPESIELNSGSVYFILTGFLLFYLLESILLVHAGPELSHFEHAGEDKLHVSGQMAFLGLFLHSLIDGIIIGIGFEVDPALGMFTTFSIIMHELPEGITTYSLMIITESKKKALIKSYAVALATPIGAILSLLFIKTIPESVIGILLALASGTFIYVAASDLIPETHNHKGVSNIICLMGGVLLIYVVSNGVH